MRKFLLPTMLFVAVSLFGCGSEPTNEPTAAAIEKANQDRFAKIDADPSMTAEQKAEMKKHMQGGNQANAQRR